METITEEEGWIVPERGAPWLQWGFGTRTTICKNEPNSVKQVHGSKVLTITTPGFAGEGDALVTQTPGLLLGIKTADCLPVLLVDMNRRLVSAVHAGWRGTAQNIVRAALQEMALVSGTNPIDVLVAMGPAIQKCCFEVSPEVARVFSEFDPVLADCTGKQNLDLQAINAWQLERMGVPATQILRNELCTVCQVKRFWSFRREQEKAGRMWSVVGITPD
jgi:YfiH family protein